MNIFLAFENSCQANKIKPALHLKKGLTSYTIFPYQDVHEKALETAGFLNSKEVQRNSHVALLMENGIHWVAGFLGLMRLGAVAVPFSPQQEPDELVQLLQHADTSLVLTTRSTLPRVEDALHNSGIPWLCLDDYVSSDPQDVKKYPLPAVHGIRGEDTALIIYTSGTTASPKGAMLTHGNILANVDALVNLGIATKTDCFGCLLPLHHAYPLTVTMLTPLLMGAKMSVMPAIEPGEILPWVNATSVTVLSGVPRLYALFQERIAKEVNTLPFIVRLPLLASLSLAWLVRKATNLNLAKALLFPLHRKFGKQFRLMISGGAKLPVGIAKDFYFWGFDILEGYGLTETSPVVAFNTPHSRKTGTVGKPLAGVEVRIDAKDASGCGEIMVKAPSVFKGYYKNPKETGEALEEGWFCTSDLGCMDRQGFLTVNGRKNDTIILSSGKKINPENLEQFYSSTPYIKELCIFLSEDPKETDALVAAIFPDLEYFKKHGFAQIKDKIRWEIERLSMQLPAYERVKRYFITNEPLPKTLLGKVKRFEAKKLFDGSQEHCGESRACTAALSQEDRDLLSSPLSRKAVRYFAEALKKEPRLDDNLELDLGLDSLERIGLFFGFQKMLGLEIDERTFLGVATVRDILRKLHEATKTEIPTYKHHSWEEILDTPLTEEERATLSLSQGFLERSATYIGHFFLWLCCLAYFRISSKGRANIPAHGPFILCPNHASFADAFLVGAALRGRTVLGTYFVGYSKYLDAHSVSWMKKLFRLISIDPAQDLELSMRLCGHVLRHKRSLCIFPEGERSLDGELKEFKKGAGILAKELSVPLIPVYINGSHEAWPATRKFPFPKKITVVFGPALTSQELGKRLASDLDIYQNIVDNLKIEVQKLALPRKKNA